MCPLNILDRIAMRFLTFYILLCCLYIVTLLQFDFPQGSLYVKAKTNCYAALFKIHSCFLVLSWTRVVTCLSHNTSQR